jgi:hypothetical protein
MAKRLAIPSEELEIKIVGTYNSFMVPRIQRYTMATDIPTTDVYELGNNTSVGSSQDTPNVNLTFSAFDVGVRVFSVLTGTDPDAYPAAGVDISELGEVDAIVYIKDADVSDYAKCAHAKRLQIQNFSFSYSVDGESTEDYTLIGSEKRYFKRDVIVDRFVAGTTTFTLSQTPVVLKNGNYALSVILDGEYLTEVAVAPSATGEYQISSTTLTTYDSRVGQLLVVYQANPAGSNWSYVSDAIEPAAIKGRDVKVLISAVDIARVQSVTINGNLNVQTVKEMGNRNTVGYQKQVPTVDGSITVLDTDTELIDLMLNGSINSGYTEFELGDACVTSGFPLKIRLIDPCTDDTVLKTIYIPSVILTGDSSTATVNQNAQYTVNIKSRTAECIVYSGSA